MLDFSIKIVYSIPQNIGGVFMDIRSLENNLYDKDTLYEALLYVDFKTDVINKIYQNDKNLDDILEEENISYHILYPNRKDDKNYSQITIDDDKCLTLTVQNKNYKNISKNDDVFYKCLALVMYYFYSYSEEEFAENYKNLSVSISDPLKNLNDKSQFEIGLIRSAMKLLVPYEEIKKDLCASKNQIEKAYNYGLNDFYWLRDNYVLYYSKKYLLSTNMIEKIFELIVKDSEAVPEIISQFLLGRYRYLDSDILKESKKELKIWNL